MCGKQGGLEAVPPRCGEYGSSYERNAKQVDVMVG